MCQCVTMTDESDRIAHSRLLPLFLSLSFLFLHYIFLYGSMRIWFACQNCLIRSNLCFELTHSCADPPPLCCLDQCYVEAAHRIALSTQCAMLAPFVLVEEDCLYSLEVWGYICLSRSPLDLCGNKYTYAHVYTII